MRYLLPLFALLSISVVTLAADCPGGYCGGQQPIWMQPTRQVHVRYPTPIRNWLFGARRTVPVGPPQPYMLVPGRVVWPELVYPREQSPQIVWPQ